MSACEEQRRYRFFPDASMIQSNSPLSVDALSFTPGTNERDGASLLTHTDVFIPLSQWHACQCDKSATKSVSYCQYVTFEACLSVQSLFHEHLLNTDLARDNVLLATPAGSECSTAGANHVCRASFFSSICLIVDSDLCKLHAKTRRRELITSGWTSDTLWVKIEFVHFFFSSLHFIYWSENGPFLGLKPKATAATFQPQLICL